VDTTAVAVAVFVVVDALILAFAEMPALAAVVGDQRHIALDAE
jgi:hypothetical protein